MKEEQQAVACSPDAQIVRIDRKAITKTDSHIVAGEQGCKGSAFHSRVESAHARVDPEVHRVLCARQQRTQLRYPEST